MPNATSTISSARANQVGTDCQVSNPDLKITSPHLGWRAHAIRLETTTTTTKSAPPTPQVEFRSIFRIKEGLGFRV